jgi:hypothetical protein
MDDTAVVEIPEYHEFISGTTDYVIVFTRYGYGRNWPVVFNEHL